MSKLNEILSKFPNGEMRYQYDALFRRCILTLLEGADHSKVMEMLFNIITDQQIVISDLSNKVPPPAVVVDTEGKGIGYLQNFVAEIIDVTAGGTKIYFDQRHFDPGVLRVNLSRETNVCGFRQIDLAMNIQELELLKPGLAESALIKEIKTAKNKII